MRSIVCWTQSRRPRMTSGDRLVLYASVWQCVFGIAEVISEPTLEDPMAERR